MRVKVITVIAAFSLGFAACTKCKTCVPLVPPYTPTSVSAYAQKVKVCRKAEIDAYENLTGFIDANLDTVKFLCN